MNSPAALAEVAGLLNAAPGGPGLGRVRDLLSRPSADFRTKPPIERAGKE